MDGKRDRRKDETKKKMITKEVTKIMGDKSTHVVVKTSLSSQVYSAVKLRFFVCMLKQTNKNKSENVPTGTITTARTRYEKIIQFGSNIGCQALTRCC